MTHRPRNAPSTVAIFRVASASILIPRYLDGKPSIRLPARNVPNKQTMAHASYGAPHLLPPGHPAFLQLPCPCDLDHGRSLSPQFLARLRPNDGTFAVPPLFPAPNSLYLSCNASRLTADACLSLAYFVPYQLRRQRVAQFW